MWILFKTLIIIIGFVYSNCFADQVKQEVLKRNGRDIGLIYHHPINVIDQTNAPVKITNARATYIPERTASIAKIWEEDYPIYSKHGILITLDAVGDSVVAFRITVHIYNSFGEHLGGLSAISTDPPNNDMQWIYSPRELFTFKGYGFVAVFLNKARLKDGTIWIYDKDEVASQLIPIIKPFEADETY